MNSLNFIDFFSFTCFVCFVFISLNSILNLIFSLLLNSRRKCNKKNILLYFDERNTYINMYTVYCWLIHKQTWLICCAMLLLWCYQIRWLRRYKITLNWIHFTKDFLLVEISIWNHFSFRMQYLIFMCCSTIPSVSRCWQGYRWHC